MKKKGFLLGVLSIALLAFVVIPSLPTTVNVEMAKEARVTKRIHNILTALTIYSGEHGGFYPKTLSELVPDFADEEDILIDSLEYVPGLDDGMPADTVILRLPAKAIGGSRGRVIIGTLDGAAHTVRTQT